MSFHAEGIDAVADGADLFVGSVGLHDNEHGRVPFWSVGSVMEGGLGGKGA